MRTGKLHLLAAAFGAALLLAGCGGGGEASPPKANVQRVIVAGDSLADVGTFGVKFTVQNSANPTAGFPVFPELVAQNFGITSQCNFFSGATFTTRAGCTNFAVAGGQIEPTDPARDNTPFEIGVQLATAAQAVGGAFAATDLILVDGGGNDAGDLAGAFLGAAAGNVAGYQAFLAQQLDAATIAATLPQANGAAIAGGLYMQKLADTFHAAIKANTLDKGALRVAVLDMPDITLTPRFRNVLAGVTATQGAAAATALQSTIRQWVDAFNARLRANAAGDARVAIVPFNADFTDEVVNFTQYGLTNATTPVCPVTGTSGGLPTFSVTTCTSAGLDAAPPAGSGAGWWQAWAFSDDFHPTPFGHRLLAASVNRALARAGWL